MFNLYIVSLIIIISKFPGINGQMNYKKVNRNGEFLSYYGYTCIAMLSSNLRIAEDIENHIRNSSLKRFYSALPASSFHMTVFNIYTCGGTLIPPVEAWIEHNNRTLTCTNGLPNKLLQDQNLKANNAIKKHINETLLIEIAEVYIRSSGIGFLVRLNFQDGLLVQNLRKELSDIYEHNDSRLDTLDKMHVTFAYGYREPNLDDDFNKDVSILKSIAMKLNYSQLDTPQVYVYDSMKNYVPFSLSLN